MPEGEVSEHVHPCTLHAEASCTDSITASLPDGPITIRFTDAPPGFNEGREASYSIVYRLTRGLGSAAGVHAAAEEQFGQLSDAADGAWCIGTGAACLEDRPRMAFRHGADGTGELLLTDLGLPARLGARMRGDTMGQSTHIPRSP